MKDRKIDKVERDLYDIVDTVISKYFCYGDELEELEDDLREHIRLLLWEYEMQNFLGD